MDGTKTALERAFELANSGKIQSVGELRRAVSREGYTATHLEGQALGRQLAQIIRRSKARTS